MQFHRSSANPRDVLSGVSSLQASQKASASKQIGPSLPPPAQWLINILEEAYAQMRNLSYVSPKILEVDLMDDPRAERKFQNSLRLQLQAEAQLLALLEQRSARSPSPHTATEPSTAWDGDDAKNKEEKRSGSALGSTPGMSPSQRSRQSLDGHSSQKSLHGRPMSSALRVEDIDDSQRSPSPLMTEDPPSSAAPAELTLRYAKYTVSLGKMMKSLPPNSLKTVEELSKTPEHRQTIAAFLDSMAAFIAYTKERLRFAGTSVNKPKSGSGGSSARATSASFVSTQSRIDSAKAKQDDTHTLMTLRETLVTAKAEHGRSLMSKDGQIARLKEQLASVRKENVASLDSYKRDVRARTLRAEQEFDAAEQSINEQLAALQARLAERSKESTEQEMGLHRRKFLRQVAASEWIAKYDRDMTDTQAQLKRLAEQYQAETQERLRLQEYFDRIDTGRALTRKATLLQDTHREHQEEHARRLNVAAMVLQQMYRTYSSMQAAQEPEQKDKKGAPSKTGSAARTKSATKKR